MVDTRWCVTYTTFVNSRKKAKHKGSMVLWAEVTASSCTTKTTMSSMYDLYMLGN
jgi:hypothetical protein